MLDSGYRYIIDTIYKFYTKNEYGVADYIQTLWLIEEYITCYYLKISSNIALSRIEPVKKNFKLFLLFNFSY